MSTSFGFHALNVIRMGVGCGAAGVLTPVRPSNLKRKKKGKKKRERKESQEGRDGKDRKTEPHQLLATVKDQRCVLVVR